MKSLLKASTLLALASPFIALAAVPPGSVTPTQPAPVSTHVDNWITFLSTWVARLAIILIAVAIVVFFWGVITYVIAGADEEKRATGRSLMIYGVIGIFVMVALWGLVYLLGSILGVTVGGGVGTLIQIPTAGGR